ncbi:MAG: hypothetical protein IJ151_09240 [Bacteroidales bacterium]|nr:hypothetical protein [Bacteroidales bacterium]
MGTLNVILLVLVAITAATVAFFLRKRLFPSWTDLYKAFADNDYSLAFYLHRQFRQQVLSGKQRYDRFVWQTNASRLSVYQNSKRTSFDVDQENTRRLRMREMLDHEDFIRSHFKDEPFGYTDWMKMLDDWNQIPVPVKETPSAVENTTTAVEETEVTYADPGLLDSLLMSGKRFRDDSDKQYLAEECRKSIGAFLANNNDGNHCGALFVFLQKKGFIPKQEKVVTFFYNAVNEAFPKSITISVRAFQKAVERVRDEDFSDSGLDLIEEINEELRNTFF